jgi:hypothetical protein
MLRTTSSLGFGSASGVGGRSLPAGQLHQLAMQHLFSWLHSCRAVCLCLHDDTSNLCWAAQGTASART